jgi:hypothetical protein
LGLLPLGLLAARARALAPVPPLISGVLQKAFDDQQLHFFSSLHQLQDSAAFSAYHAPLRQAEWVVYGARSFISAASLPNEPMSTSASGCGSSVKYTVECLNSVNPAMANSVKAAPFSAHRYDPWAEPYSRVQKGNEIDRRLPTSRLPIHATPPN